VQEVTPDKVILTIKDSKDKDAKPKVVEIDSGFTLWSTGIGELFSSIGRFQSSTAAMQPFTKRLVELLPNQFHSKAVQVDGFLRVKGAPAGTVYALGDASTVCSPKTSRDGADARSTVTCWHTCLSYGTPTTWTRTIRCAWRLKKLDHADSSTYAEWQKMAADIKKKYPLASKYLGKVRAIFDEFDKDKDEKLSLNECASMFESLSKKVTSLPAVSAIHE
jgi:NADH dehydrogenase